jgi:hypothetical protein
MPPKPTPMLLLMRQERLLLHLKQRALLQQTSQPPHVLKFHHLLFFL